MHADGLRDGRKDAIYRDSESLTLGFSQGVSLNKDMALANCQVFLFQSMRFRFNFNGIHPLSISEDFAEYTWSRFCNGLNFG